MSLKINSKYFFLYVMSGKNGIDSEIRKKAVFFNLNILKMFLNDFFETNKHTVVP